jgi:Nuclear cap-binding protein subunit 3
MADANAGGGTAAGDRPPLSATASLQTSLAARREQHARRAARFGMETVAPVRDFSVLGANRAAARRDGGFVTGFDIAAPDQAEKRAARAARFAAMDSADGSATGAGEATGGASGGALGDAPQLGLPAGAAPSGGLAGAAPLGQGLNGDLAAAPLVVVATVDPLENRRDVAIGETVRPNVLHVFGVDDMSTDDIRRHFLEYGPSWIEWINDSSCNVTFEDEHTATRVLTFMVPPPEDPAAASAAGGGDGGTASIPDAPPDRMSDADGAGLSVPVAAEGAVGLAPDLLWRRARPFLKHGRNRNSLTPLWMRRATELDVRPERPNPRSKWARSVVGVAERERAREKGRQRAAARRERVVTEGAEREELREDDVREQRRRGGRRGRKGGGDDGGEDALRPAIARRLGVRGGIAKARARKPTLMDVDRALESKR